VSLLGKGKLWIMGATLHNLSRFVGMVACAGFSNVALAQGSPPPVPDGPWHMMHDWGPWGPGGMVLGPLIMIVWLAVLVAIIVGLVRWLGGRGGDGRRSTPTAREILDERYARGEIDREEYLKRKRDIAGS
jgi:putative membrane protein